MSEEETAPVAEITETDETVQNEVSAEEEVSEEEQETTDQSDVESETADEEKAKPDPRDKKIAELSYKERESRRKIARMEAMLEQSIQNASKSDAKAPPKLEDFETIDEYVDAKLDWKLSQVEAKPEAKAEDSNLDAVIEVAKNDLYAAGLDKYDDFAEVVGAEHVPMTQTMAQALFEIENTELQADAAYFLGNNLKEAARIAKLSPIRQAGEIAKLEAKLSNKAKPKKQASKAPEPIKPVGGAKTTSDEIRESMDFEDFMKVRNKQLGR